MRGVLPGAMVNEWWSSKGAVMWAAVCIFAERRGPTVARELQGR